MIIMLRVDLSEEDVGQDFIDAMLFMVNAFLPSASLTIGILMKGLSTSEKIHRAVRTSSTGVEIPMEFENPMREAGSKDLEMLE
jgi:hypothetical protein